MWMKIFILFAGYLAVSGEFVPVHKNFSTLQAALEDAEKYITKFNETHNFPSLVFGLSVKGKTVFEKAWGYADLENWVPAKLSTKYVIASISKTFTAALIAGLVDKGLVKFEDPIDKYVGKSLFPTKKWNGTPVNVTLRHLMSHTGGVRVDAEEDFVKIVPVTNVTQAVYRFKDEPLQFKPGTNFNYSNYGFQLLGAAIESVTKKPFNDVMLEFLHKNGMAHSLMANLSLVIPETARYYQRSVHSATSNSPSIIDQVILATNGFWPAGGVISTVDDMLKYGQMMIDSYKGRSSSIISSKTVKAMWTPTSPPADTIKFITQHYQIISDYGLGWLVAKSNSKLKHQKMMWHAGGTAGIATMLIVYPEEEIVGVALANKGGGQDLAPMIMNTVENVYSLVK